MTMKTAGVILFVLLSSCGRSLDAKLAPDFIHPCNSTEPACLVRATQDAIPQFVKGIPHLGVEVLDPFVIKELAITLPGALKVTFIDGKVTGFKKCVVDDVRSELEERRFQLAFHCNLTIRGKYKANGRILLFPINGDGDAKIKLYNLRMVVNLNTKYVKDENGLVHFAFRNYNYNYDYGDKVTFALTNLFKGNPALSSTVLAFMNENWQQVSEEFGGPLVKYAVDLAMATAEKFFLAVPYEELLDLPLPKAAEEA